MRAACLSGGQGALEASKALLHSGDGAGEDAGVELHGWRWRWWLGCAALFGAATGGQPLYGDVGRVGYGDEVFNIGQRALEILAQCGLANPTPTAKGSHGLVTDSISQPVRQGRFHQENRPFLSLGCICGRFSARCLV